MLLRLFEFEDQSWFPDWLRDYQTDYLAFVYELFSLYHPTELMLEREWKNPSGTLVDLCAGAGFSILAATATLRQNNYNILMCDKFPNRKAAARISGMPGVQYLLTPVDLLADALPKAELYTMFNAFHHFNAEEKLLLTGKLNGTKLVVIEPLQPNLIVFLKVMLITTLGLLLLIPFVRPFSWKSLLLTYVFPIGIFVTFWDGMASVLKAMSRKDMAKFAENAAENGITVRYGILKGTFARLTYLIIE